MVELSTCKSDVYDQADHPEHANWLIWSNEHGSWWAPNESGYTLKLSEAGRYSFKRAIEICRDAGFRRSTFSHYDIRVPNECMMLAPDEKVSELPKPLTQTLKKETL